MWLWPEDIIIIIIIVIMIFCHYYNYFYGKEMPCLIGSQYSIQIIRIIMGVFVNM